MLVRRDVKTRALLVIVAAVIALSPTAARADRLEAYAGAVGFCQFDNWLNTERSLAATTYYFGMVTRCYGGLPVTGMYSNAYLSTDAGLGWSLASRVNMFCQPPASECFAANDHSSAIDVRAKNESDGTVDLGRGGTSKNPNSIRFTGTSDPSRCQIYNGGYSVWCKGLLVTYR